MMQSAVEPGNAADLGTLLEEFPAGGRAGFRWAARILGSVLLLGGILFLGFGLYSGYSAYYRHGPAVVRQNLLLPVSLGLLFLLLGGLILVSALARNGKSIVIYEHGFMLHDRKVDEAWRWDDLASIRTAVTRQYFLGIRSGNRHMYTLARRDGERLVLDDRVRGVETLADRIREKALPMLYARYVPSLLHGQELAFGPVQVCKEKGIVIGKKTLAWGRIHQAVVENGALTITTVNGQKTPRTVRIPVAEVPNVDILLAIIQEMVECEPTPGSKSGAGG